MILVIDVGNTRLKWAWLTSTGLSDQQAVVHRDAKPGMWTAALFESGQKPSRVLISNVAGPVMAKTLARMTKKAFKVAAEFVTAAPEFRRSLERLSRSESYWARIDGSGWSAPGPRLDRRSAWSMRARRSRSTASMHRVTTWAA
jgi:hypothetical protein